MNKNNKSNSAEAPARTLRAIISAFCASLIGIGFARFSYTPLLPAIIEAHWFEPSAAAYLGAANLAGYLIGALLGRQASAHSSVTLILRAMMLLASVAFLACAYPVSFLWFFIWRFVSGLAGGVLMILVAPAVLSSVSPSRRGLAGGAIFMGVGAGVVASGTIVPLLLQKGLQETWLCLGGLSSLLTIVAWTGWPKKENSIEVEDTSRLPQLTALRALYIEYALNAFSWVPHMIFLVDFIARGLNEGVHAGSHYWVVFGFGAMVGPVLVGYLADKTGFGVALRVAYFIEIFAIALPVFGLGSFFLVASTFVVGAFMTGTVPLVLGRIHELLPTRPLQRKTAWSSATIAFALLQACGAYVFSFIFAQSGGNYTFLFMTGSTTMALALAINLGVAIRNSRLEERD